MEFFSTLCILLGELWLENPLVFLATLWLGLWPFLATKWVFRVRPRRVKLLAGEKATENRLTKENTQNRFTRMEKGRGNRTTHELAAFPFFLCFWERERERERERVKGTPSGKQFRQPLKWHGFRLGACFFCCDALVRV